MINDYTRVTDVLRFCSSINLIPKDILMKAGLRGTKVHESIDAIISSIGVRTDPEIQGYIDSFNQWYPKDFLEKPDRFFCDKYKITGECDGIYKDGEDLVLIDFKTPIKESSTWNIQLSAYAYLARSAGYQISRIEVLKLDRTGKEPTVYVYDDQFEIFLSCLEVYRYFHEGKETEDYLDYI